MVQAPLRHGSIVATLPQEVTSYVKKMSAAFTFLPPEVTSYVNNPPPGSLTFVNKPKVSLAKKSNMAALRFKSNHSFAKNDLMKTSAHLIALIIDKIGVLMQLIALINAHVHV
jgi:hypothetical protein